jgi:hypothetical protein
MDDKEREEFKLQIVRLQAKLSMSNDLLNHNYELAQVVKNYNRNMSRLANEIKENLDSMQHRAKDLYNNFKLDREYL